MTHESILSFEPDVSGMDTGPAEPAGDAEGVAVPLRERPALGSEPVLYTPRGERLEFPGCQAVRVTADEIDEMEGPEYRFEYWDGDVETAWLVNEPVTAAHEKPGTRLARLGEIIAAARGGPIECCGAMGLWVRDERSRRRRARKVMEADQTVYVHPRQARMPEGSGMELGVDDCPDVVLEVDHTTDVRRGKLKVYEWWRFPELWVEVPEVFSRSRRAGAARLTIYLLGDDGRYLESAASRAFPGWTGVEIHHAMNEPYGPSVETSRVLARVAGAMSAREGTGPDDTPWLRMHRDEARAEGRAQGRAEHMEVVIRELATSRGLSPAGLLRAAREAREHPGAIDDRILAALFACEDETDFRMRLQAPAR